MLELNITLPIQIITYLLLLYAFNQLMFKPVMAILEERKKRTEGARTAAGEIEGSVDEGLASYKEKLKEETIKAQEARGRIRQEAVKKEQALLEKAKKAVAAELAGIKDELDKSKAEAMVTLTEDARSISRTIAEKVLDRKLASFILPLLFIPMLFIAMLPDVAHASGSDSTSMYWRIANFSVFFIAFTVLWFKFGKPLLEKRGAAIEAAIAEAEEAKKAAEARRGEYEKKLALLDEKVSTIQEDLKSEAAAESERILKEAEESVLKIKAQAKAAAEQEVKKAKLALQREAGRLAVEMAEELLTKELKDSDQKNLAKDYISKLSLNG